MNKLILAGLLCYAVLMTNCTHSCLPNHITPVFVGYSPADIDSFVVRRYRPNDNYLHLIDTVLIVNPKTGYYIIKNDTTIVYLNSVNPHNYISTGFDWQIYIPAKNKLVAISNITGEGREISCWKCGCLDGIVSFMQDAQPKIPQVDSTALFGYTTVGYVAYIHN